jgi:hypothetical protein
MDNGWLEFGIITGMNGYGMDGRRPARLTLFSFYTTTWATIRYII